MNFYESLVSGFVERARAMAGFTKEEEKALAAELMKESSCRALQEIREVLRDGRLEDPECFRRIEQIVTVYEDLGSDGGGRHDFG